MPKAFPREFRENVIRVYRDADASMAQVAKDFGVSASCLKRWLSIDERDSTPRSTSSGGESDALREANKRIKLARSTGRRRRAGCGLPGERAVRRPP